MARPASTPRSRQAAPYRRRDPTREVLHRLVRDHGQRFLSENENVLDAKRGYLRPEVRVTLESYLECGVLGFGLALHKCDRCKLSRFVALSCRRRGICSRCRAKTLAIWSEWLDTDVLPRVPYRQWVLTLPKRIRQLFRFDASLNKRLSRILYRVICDFVRARTGRDDLEVAFIACDQSFGSLLAFLPHQHALVSDGGFTPNGELVPLGRVRDRERRQLEELLRRRILCWLVRIDKLPSHVAKSMLAWTHSGFSLHLRSRAHASDRQGLLRLATYMRRHSFSPNGIRYNERSGKVIYKSPRMHAGKKRDFEVFDAVDFVATLADHIPHRRKHEVRYLGAANPKIRKRLFGSSSSAISVGRAEPACSDAKGKRSWARLIYRVFEVDPLACSCGGTFRLKAIVLNQRSVHRLLAHAGLPTQLPTTATARAPPTLWSPPAWTEATVPVAANEYTNPEPASHWDVVDPEPVYEDGDFIPSDDLLAIDPP